MLFKTLEELNKELSKAKQHAFLDIPPDLYHASDAVSHSSLKRMEESAAKYKWELDHPNERPPSKAFELGTAIHCALLEPEVFEKTYAAMPKFDGRTKEGKAGKADWEISNQGKIGLQPEEWKSLTKVRQSVLTDQFYKQFFVSGKKEKSFFADDPETGLRLRCRPDNYVVESGIVVDLKTTDDASQHSFNIDITKYKYFVQASFYVDVLELATGVRPKAFVIVAVEKTKDCDMNAFYISEEELELGRKMYRTWLRKLSECIKSNAWSGYERQFIRYKAPQWLVEQYSNERK